VSGSDSAVLPLSAPQCEILFVEQRLSTANRIHKLGEHRWISGPVDPVLREASLRRIDDPRARGTREPQSASSTPRAAGERCALARLPLTVTPELGGTAHVCYRE